MRTELYVNSLHTYCFYNIGTEKQRHCSKMERDTDTANVAYITAICLASILLNGIEISLLLYEKRTKIAFDVTLMSLAFADLLISLSLIGYLFHLPELLEHILRHAIFTSSFTSAVHLMFIAVQRLIAVFYPFKAATLLTRKRCCIIISSLWIVSVVTSVPIIFRNDDYYRVYLCTPVVFGSAILLLYVALNYNMLTRRKISMTRNSFNQNLHVMIYSTSITLAFLICTFPYTILLMKNTYTPQVPYYAFYLYILHVALDPVLYFLFHYLKAKKHFQCCVDFFVKTQNEEPLNIMPKEPNVER